MKLHPFFKLLNKKIKAYENATINPFAIPQPITVVWVNDDFDNKSFDHNNYNNNL